MLLNILNTFALHTGMQNPAQRPAMLNYINRASKDMYNKIDADAMLEEIVLQVPSGFQCSLPPFIGELKGLREWGYSTTVSLNSIGVPRFSSDASKYRWRNWTYKGKRALQNDIKNASILVLSAIGIEITPAIIVVTGRTANSQRVAESITMNNTIVNSINQFQYIESITSTSIRTYDITIQSIGANPPLSIDGLVLAILYNNENCTAYNIVDVSNYSWLNSLGNGGGITLMELLYKRKFYPFINDTDSFLAEGFDDAIAYEAVLLWALPQDDKAQMCQELRLMSSQIINNNIQNDENGQVRKVQMKANMSYILFKRFRSVFDWRRSTWGGRY